MGFIEDAKETADTAGRKIQDAWEDMTDKVGDKVDAAKADANVKKAEAEKSSVETRNDIKAHIRDDDTRATPELVAAPGRDSWRWASEVLAGPSAFPAHESRRPRLVCGSRVRSTDSASERGDPPRCRAVAPGSITISPASKSYDAALNASGAQVIGSTARPARWPGWAAPPGRSAVWICTHGHAASQTSSTPVPEATVSRTVA